MMQEQKLDASGGDKTGYVVVEEFVDALEVPKSKMSIT